MVHSRFHCFFSWFCLIVNLPLSNSTCWIVSISFLLPWVSQWPLHWQGWRCDHGGCWWTQHDWTGRRARETGSFLSWRWTLWRDHPFDRQPGDYSQSSCNRTGLPERERRCMEESKEGRKDRRGEGRSRRRVIERHRGLRGTRRRMDREGKKIGATTGRSTKKRRE